MNLSLKILSGLSLLLLTPGAFAASGDLQVSGGDCHLETPQENFIPNNVDESMHFGIFALGGSSQNDTIRLQHTNRDVGGVTKDVVTITMIGNTEVGASLQVSYVAPVKEEKIRVQTSIWIPESTTRKSTWMACDLEVSRIP